jgi:hypothetical protein
MVRRMIIDSLKYWMTEYRIDGFRFDLAASHDKETIAAIYKELKAINPNVYLIAEPWGGAGLSQAGDFLDLGWSKWEAGIRDAVRATNRPTREGAVWALGNTGNALQIGTYWGGTTAGEPWQHVAYIESHDDTTLGDNLRVQSGFYKFAINGKEPNRITDIEAYLTLTPQLLDANRVAASALFLSQGPVMIHLGQEWARGKVIPDLSDEMKNFIKGLLVPAQTMSFSRSQPPILTLRITTPTGSTTITSNTTGTSWSITKAGLSCGNPNPFLEKEILLRLNSWNPATATASG